MTQEIGSDFHLPLGFFFKKKVCELAHDRLYFISGRACIEAIIKNEKLSGKTVLLPSYLCESILIPFRKHKVTIAFFSVEKNLEINLADLKKKIQQHKPRAVFIIHYFGFIQKNMEKIHKLVAKNKVVLVEDLVQSYLTNYVPHAEYSFNSYRKSLPVPDGAFLRANKHISKHIAKVRPATSTQRTLALYRKIFKHYEKHGVNKRKIQGMSLLARDLLVRINKKEVIHRRKNNYAYLLKRCNEEGLPGMVPLFAELPKKVCPLGFPVMIADNKRDAVCRHLIKNKVYCPVHWKLPQAVDTKAFKDSFEVSKNILTIPIDQRYSPGDMERVVQCLKNFA
jgi:dTDP-4-amino-4,6-dideoxygalactose transaminase